MKKRIGLVAWPTGQNSFGATVPYLNFFSKFGIVELIMPNETEIREVDLLVLPGGPDVDTKRYLGDKALSFFIGKTCPFRERFDDVLLPKYINAGTPIFGICRGLQTLAVTFGASLIQDMWHETSKEHERSSLVHKAIVNKSYVNQMEHVPNDNFEVNSLHHQVIDQKNLPEAIKVLARYAPPKGEIKHDGSIEAISMWPEYPIHAVQWHPEEIHDKFSISLIFHLLNDKTYATSKESSEKKLHVL